MSELRLETLTMPAADVGPESPLPPLFSTHDLHTVVDPGEADAEMRHNIGYGRACSVLPYLVQDGYGRDRRTSPLVGSWSIGTRSSSPRVDEFGRRGRSAQTWTY